MKKKIFTSIILLMGSAIFSGCGNNTQSNNVNQPNEEVSEVEASESIEDSETADAVTEETAVDLTGGQENDILGETVTDMPENDETDDFVYNHNMELSTAIIDDLQKENLDENVSFSETSLNYALDMLYEGAGDGSDTKNQLYDYLIKEYNLSSDTDLSATAKATIDDYKNRDNIQLNIANSVWVDKKSGVKDTYIKSLQDKLGAYSENVDMSDAKTADKINDWVSDATNEKIDSIVQHADISEADAVLINALYFNAKWRSEFSDESITEGIFTNSDGSESVVNMLNGSADGYLENNQAKGFVKYYKDGNTAFIGILPNEEGGYSLNELDLDSLLDSCEKSETQVSFPEFKTESNVQLQDILKVNGLDSLFNTADFSNMSDGNLTVDKIIQKTYVDVNAKGTEAAASTAVTLMKSSGAVANMVVIDRPFAYMIYDTNNNEVLFVGKVNKL